MFVDKSDPCFFNISVDPWLLPAQVLRRAQFALKVASAEGSLEDGSKPSRKPKAKAKSRAKAKAKAKAKATPKAVAKAKAKAKAKSQSRKKTEPKETQKEEGNMEPEIAENMEPEIAENMGPEIAENLSNPPAPPPKKAKTVKKKNGDGKIPADSSDKPKKSAKRACGDGLDCTPEKDGPVEEKVAYKCFAKRRRPSGQFTSLKWDSLRSAFEQKVKPLLESYSAHEDRFSFV